MQHKKFVACAAAALMAVALGCSNDSPTPVSPTGAEPGASGAGPAGETLKATAPTPQSPINNQQPDALVLVAGKSSPDLRYGHAGLLVRVRDYATAAARRRLCATTVAGGSGSSVQASPSCTLEFDQPYTWRARALLCGRGRSVVGQRDVPRARRRLHPRQRSDGSADQRPDGRTKSRARSSSCPVRASAWSTTAAT